MKGPRVLLLLLLLLLLLDEGKGRKGGFSLESTDRSHRMYVHPDMSSF